MLLLDRDRKRMLDLEFSCSPILERVRERYRGERRGGLERGRGRLSGERRIQEGERGDEDWRKGREREGDTNSLFGIERDWPKSWFLELDRTALFEAF